MSDTIHIEKLNEVYMRLNCEPALLREVGEFFSFLIPNHKFHPLVKSKVWNGRINLLDYRKGTLYIGLREHLRKFAEDRGYVVTGLEHFDPEYVTVELDKFLKEINVPFELHDFQEGAIRHAIAHKSVTMLSATSSGKSLIIYLLARYMESISGRTLIIVPSVTLVNQLWSDFKEYSVDNGWNYDNVHRVTAGICKTTDLPITISTWQSLQKLKDKAAFMSNFDMAVIDECFDPSTRVLTTEGWLSLSHVTTATEIINIDDAGDLKVDQVVKVHSNISPSERMYELVFDEGTKLRVTGNHKFMLEDGSWKRADEITFEDQLKWVDITKT